MWLLLLVSLVQTAGETGAVQPTPRLVDRRGVMDCTLPLNRDVLDRSVQVQCRVGEAGRLHDCVIPQSDDLTQRQQTAARCLAGLYAVDGMAVGQSATIPVRLRMNSAPPPPGFTPPGNR